MQAKRQGEPRPRSIQMHLLYPWQASNQYYRQFDCPTIATIQLRKGLTPDTGNGRTLHPKPPVHRRAQVQALVHECGGTKTSHAVKWVATTVNSRQIDCPTLATIQQRKGPTPDTGKRQNVTSLTTVHRRAQVLALVHELRRNKDLACNTSGCHHCKEILSSKKKMCKSNHRCRRNSQEANCLGATCVLQPHIVKRSTNHRIFTLHHVLFNPDHG